MDNIVISHATQQAVQFYVTTLSGYPTQEVISQTIDTLGAFEYFYEGLYRYTPPAGMDLYMPSDDFLLVYCIGDSIIEALVAADLAELPELLVWNHYLIRRAASKKFKVLTKCKS